MTNFYVLFENHTHGMALYRYCRDSDINVHISPTPRAASVCCGISLLVSPDDIKAVQKCIEESGISILKIVELPQQINPKRDIYC